MLVAEYIVKFLVRKGITDVFGYPGGMIMPLMEAFRLQGNQIRAHVMYHEQAAAFAACGYAQASGKPGVAYSSSGPGATNLITGICNAYFDSIPCIFITGQVNKVEAKGKYGVRQRGFQETDIISMVKPVTKYAVLLDDVFQVQEVLEQAYCIATAGRPGPVVLDIPMDVLRMEMRTDSIIENYSVHAKEHNMQELLQYLTPYILSARRPVLLLGNGLRNAQLQATVRELVQTMDIPAVTSMIAVDILGNLDNNMGFIGAYGHRAANFAVAKSDLVITIGSRLDIRQVGKNREQFAPHAKLIRFDVDEGEFSYRVHDDECQIHVDLCTALNICRELFYGRDYADWKKICALLKQELRDFDVTDANHQIQILSQKIPDHVVVTTDVGQNQVWVAQSFRQKGNQKILFSGGHGAMGYSLPAAIGAYYGSGHRNVYCITGDGGMQMNIQELQYIAREQLPAKIIVFNNDALGMMRHFQEMYYDGNFFQTNPEGGYSAPDFAKIAEAYGITAYQVDDISEAFYHDVFEDDRPVLIEIRLKGKTYVFPKLKFGMPNQDQEPLLDRKKYDYLMSL